ncbi:hypothetical protein QNI19_26715 [Cytophagaceae bacterium DM2B3-1]|uniref:Uncharacterized protein n=1 Tax=Xanthocytophaga flava TaxID=3048013 RepID=A0ABT7CVA8_9BACT|nr:hypothetical protein [Xanthocytophaga flavus]MDJ1496554.1 hypothetical protein [Xanthocytophaga flavus]
MAAKAKKSEVTVKDSKPERILINEYPEQKSAMEKAHRGYLPTLRKAVQSYIQLGYVEPVNLEFINRLVFGGLPEFDQAYRSWFYDETPSVNMLPMEKAAVLPHLRLPQAYIDFKSSIDDLISQCETRHSFLDISIPFPLTISFYELEENDVKLNEAALLKYLEISTESYLEDPVHIELYQRLTALVTELNILQDFLHKDLFGEKTFLHGIINHGTYPGMGFQSSKASIKLDIMRIKGIPTYECSALNKLMNTSKACLTETTPQQGELQVEPETVV